ncbi:hypothetical protein QQX98_007114 [Neonectria punicea]|uniref:Kinesin-like protein n=1 Tax=Neonectria punicea TaxID=979145 RepID=A0ABR1GZ80_9HYPO
MTTTLDFEVEQSAEQKAKQLAEKCTKNAEYEKLVKRERFFLAPVASKATPVAGKNTIIAVRLRPRLGEEKVNDEPQAVFVRRDAVDTHPVRYEVRSRQPKLDTHTFSPDKAYDADTTTEQIFDDIVNPLITEVCNGGVATFLAYGQTGSGKTHTVSQIQKLASKAIFQGKHLAGRSVKLWIIELAGNSAHDLINDGKEVKIREDWFHNTHIRGVLEVDIENSKTMLEYIEKASALRRTSVTDKNSASSRSHAICRIQISRKGQEKVGELYLVDLAGSEVARDTVEYGKQRFKETREINSSLSTLYKCIQSKAKADAGSRKNARVPFRESVLTRVLKPIFDPGSNLGCKLVVLACVAPCLEDLGPGSRTLQYAKDCRGMVARNKPVAYDCNVPTTWSNAELKSWIRENSGTPPINGDLLAPSESGALIIRLDAHEFEERCLKTDGVSSRQAIAVQSKLWLLHTDSKKPRSEKQASAIGTTTEEPNPITREIFWKERIRPGMVVEYVRPDPQSGQPVANLAMVLSDVTAVSPTTLDCFGQQIDTLGINEMGVRFLCGTLVPCGAMGNSGFDAQVLRQVTVDLNEMTSEVIMTKDEQTRLYFVEI